jgi:hypothetical protein
MEAHAHHLEPILTYVLVDHHFLDKIANFDIKKKAPYFKSLKFFTKKNSIFSLNYHITELKKRNNFNFNFRNLKFSCFVFLIF